MESLVEPLTVAFCPIPETHDPCARVGLLIQSEFRAEDEKQLIGVNAIR
jgi:hypothetical protein